MRVFISLKEEVKSNPKLRQEALEAAMALPLDQDDRDRRMWEKYDLLRGTLKDAAQLEQIEAKLGSMIEAVEVDEVRSAT